MGRTPEKLVEALPTNESLLIALGRALKPGWVRSGNFCVETFYRKQTKSAGHDVRSDHKRRKWSFLIPQKEQSTYVGPSATAKSFGPHSRTQCSRLVSA